MKKILVILAVLIVIFSISGCASVAQGTSQYFSDNVSITRRGEATNTVWFGVFGTMNYPPAETVARDNGITRIASVERYMKIGVLGFWVEYTTIVTGQ